MKSLIRMILLGGLAMLALSGIATTSASAAACAVKAGSGDYGLCVNGSALEGSVTAEARTTAPLVVDLEEWTGGPSSIQCKEITSSDTFTAEKSSVSVKAGRSSIAGCSLPSKEALIGCKTEAEGALPENGGPLTSGESFEFNSASDHGHAIWEWHLLGSGCALEGEHGTEGVYECKLHEAKVEAVEHELICEGKKTWQMYTEDVRTPLSYKQTISLTGAQKGEKFSIYEG